MWSKLLPLKYQLNFKCEFGPIRICGIQRSHKWFIFLNIYFLLPNKVFKVKLNLKGAERISFTPFTTDIDSFKMFIKSVKAVKNFDECEDVFGGLEEVLNLSWINMTRVLFHIGDSPCHGRRFYVSAHDDYPEGDINGLNITDLMKKLSSLKIHYYFAEINASTQKMIAEFDKELQSLQGHPIKTVSLYSADDLLKTLATSVTESIMHSKSLSLTNSAGKTKKSFILNRSPINWSALGMVKHKVEFYDSSIDGKLCDVQNFSINFMKNDTIMFIAPSPFANGALRLATVALLEINGFQKKVVLKESLFVERLEEKHDTEKNIKTSIEGQIMACFLAKEFTKISPSQKNIRFLEIGYLRDI